MVVQNNVRDRRQWRRLREANELVVYFVSPEAFYGGGWPSYEARSLLHTVKVR